jgi:phage terminase large subunit-like protein
VDIGGERAASAVVWVTEDLRVGCQVFQGTEAVLAVLGRVRNLAAEYDVRELAYDPWRFTQAALDWRPGDAVVEFPQSHERMTRASERLHAAVTKGRLRHPNDPELNRHVAQAIAKDTPRGWRLDKSGRAAQIDAVVALAMAVERAEQPQPKRTRYMGML